MRDDFTVAWSRWIEGVREQERDVWESDQSGS